jgi:quercetin dioxygenase-like cupin family protein
MNSRNSIRLGRSTSSALLALLAASAVGCATSPRQNPQTATAGSGKIVVTRPTDYRTVSQAWGDLTWFVSADQGNCSSMTVGRATLKPGQASLRHLHPNCDEVLHVVKGRITHSLSDGTETPMSAGDTITIPMGIPHFARNVGDEDAVMILSFSSAYRKVINQ